MEGDEEAIGETSGHQRKSGSVRMWPRRSQSSGRLRPRITFLAQNWRRDRGGEQGQGGLGTRSPPSGRRTSLGGNNINVRDELSGSVPGLSTAANMHHGRHSIRYQHSMSDSCLEEVKQEETLNDPGGTRPVSLASSTSSGVATAVWRSGEKPQDTIAEEDGPVEEDGDEEHSNTGNSKNDSISQDQDQHQDQNRIPGQDHDMDPGPEPPEQEETAARVHEENGRQGEEHGDARSPGVAGGGSNGGEGECVGGAAGDGSGEGGKDCEGEHNGQDGGRERGEESESSKNSVARGVDLTNLDALAYRDRDAAGLPRPISPASGPADLRPHGSISPSRVELPARQRMNSWAPVLSPPVLSGPFSRSRSKSRSPRRLSMGGDFARRMSGEFARTAITSKEPSVCSGTEEVSVWNDGDLGLTATGQGLGPLPGEEEGEEDEDGGGDEEIEDEKSRSGGPFSESALEMARLRLPNMELGFEDEGFFGIDPRRLIIGREIARGAFGVVHEAVLLEHPSENEEMPANVASAEGEGGDGGGGKDDQGNATEAGDVVNGTVSTDAVAEPSPGERPETGVGCEDDQAQAQAQDQVPTQTCEGDSRADAVPKDGPEITEGEGDGSMESAAITGNTVGEPEAGEQDDRQKEMSDYTAVVEDSVNRVNATDVADASQALASVVAEDEPPAEANAKQARASVAVKIQQVPLDEEEQANLLGELAMLRNHSHPHLVEYIGTALAMERGVDTVMIAMEWCINGALREALKLNISWPLKVRIARDMTDGLQFLHAHGIIHRDIKTPNVLIDSSWKAKLCDYNFAIDESSSIKQEFCAGTAEFMSPEVLLSEEYGLASDIFSLGMIFVEMLTGKEPSATFPERPPQSFFVVNEDEIQGELLEGCPSSFSLLQSQCLFAEPAERPTAEDAYGWLQDLLNEMGTDEIKLPKRGPPLPVLTEGAAIAREGNVINASPKGTEPHWFDAEAMELQINSMVENAVERALADRDGAFSAQPEMPAAARLDEETSVHLEEMQEEINALRTACEERDSRISALEVQALRNNATLKMLSSALEVAYKMLEGQQANRLQSNSLYGGADDALPDAGSSGRDSIERDGNDVRS